MASQLKVQRIIPPYLGLDTDSAPEILAPERANYHANWVLDRSGACVMRGPLLKVTNNTGTAEQNVADPQIGAWALDDALYFAQGSGAASARVAPWEALWKYAASEAELVVGAANSARGVDLKSPFAEGAAGASVGSIPWGNSHASLCGAIWAPNTRPEAGASSVVGGHRRWNTGVVRIAPGGSGLDSSGDWWGPADRPGYIVAAESHYSRLFVCAAQDGTAMSTFGGYTTDYNPHQIYWTDPVTSADAFVITAAGAWQDDVSLQINKATVGQPSLDDGCIGLAKQDRNMVIFKRNSIHVLYGYGAATWNIRQVADNFGCIDPQSIVKTGTDVYFMSQQGFMRYDGVRFTNVSSRLRSTLVRYAINRCGPKGTDGGFVRATPHRDGYILVTVGVMNYQTGVTTVDFCGYYYPPFDSWSWFSSTAISTHDNWESGSTLAGGLLGFVNTNNYSIGYTTDRFYDAQYLFFPEKAPTANYGRDQSATNAANIQATTARFDSKLYNLSSPLMQSAMKAIHLDHMTQLNSGAEDASNNTFVTLLNGAGDSILAQTGLGSASDSSAKTRRRWQRDVFTETGDMADVQLRVEVIPSAAVKKAQVYGATALYQASQERRSA